MPTCTWPAVTPFEKIQFPSLEGQGMIAVDCETFDPDLKDRGPGAHRGGFVAGVAVGTEAGFRQYYPVAHESGPNLPKKKVFKWLKEQMQLPVPKVGAHLLYDLGFLAEEGISPEGPFYDVQNAEPLLSESRLSYSLEALSREYLGAGKADEAMDQWLVEKFGKKNPKSNIWRAPYEVVAPYAVGDVNHPLEIFAKQKKMLEDQDLWDLFVMESKLIPMLLMMRRRGVRVDLDRAEQMLASVRERKAALLAEVKRISGHDLDMWAASSVAKIFDELQIPYLRTPKTDKPSFTAPWLLAQEAPVAKMIVEARRLDKLDGTFLVGCILKGHTKGRVHCQFNQLKGEGGGAVGGRFSSSAPNLQFIPVRTEDGKMMRKMFLPDEGQLWWKKDFSQIEFRLVVHDAAECNMRGARDIAQMFADDPTTDFHKMVAELAGISRSFAKTINFGLIYGEGIVKLCGQLGMTLQQGEEFLRSYHGKIPFIRALSQRCMTIAKTKGEILTLMKRRRRFPWVSTNRKTGQVFVTPHRIPGSKRGFTHAALNARTQGSAADIMKKSMVDVWESGACDEVGVQLTIHDELDGSAPRTRRAKEALAEISRIMEGAAELLVPLKVDSSIGPNWGECE